MVTDFNCKTRTSRVSDLRDFTELALLPTVTILVVDGDGWDVLV